MAQFQRHFVQDLTETISIRQCGDLGFTGDNLSDVISVDLYTDGVAYSGGGTCAGACICPDGSTVALTGSVSGKTASVSLTEDCFAIPGQIGIAIRVTTGTTKTTVLKAIYNVEPFSTDNPVDPGSRITLDVDTLINRIDAATADIPASDMASLMTGIAPTFSATTAYSAGAYVYYNGTLYRFTADHAAGSWTGTDATAVALGNDVADLKSTCINVSGIIKIRNGSSSNYGNANCVSTEDIYPYNDASSILIKINRPLSSGAVAYRIHVTTYTVKSGKTGDNVSNRVTNETIFNGDRVYIKKGFIDNTSVGFGVYISQVDSGGNLVPVRITDFSDDNLAIIYDYTDLRNSEIKSNIISTNLMCIDVQDNLYPGSADWSGNWVQSVTNSFFADGTTINGYPAVKGTSAWRSIKKDIPVELGKTYTFQAWVKAANASDFRIYLDSSTNPATTNPTTKQYTGTTNNTWRKIDLTFSCTASGNVAPCVVNANGGDFYIARYVLVEGDKVFSLADEISNNNQNITAINQDITSINQDITSINQDITSINQDITSINQNITSIDQDIESINTEVNASKNTLKEYIYGVDSTFTLTPTSSQYTINYPVKVGMAFDISIVISGTTSDGGQKNVQLLDDVGVVKTYYNSSTETYKVTRDATFFKFILNKTGTWTGLNAVITVKRSGTMVNGEFPSFTLYKDGTGNFTSLVEAIETAEQYNGATLYIGSGTWDVLAELGDDYLAAVSSSESTWGLVLKNNIHVICSNQTVFTANYTGNNSNVRTYLSVFNAGPNGFTLENARIISSNIRYCVHDDRGSYTDAYNNHYINCNMYHDNSGNTVFGGWQCIGGGFGKNGTITIEHCVFDGLNQYGSDTLGGIVSYHNSYSSGAKSKLIVKDCYFGHRTTVRFSWYGTSTDISEAYIIGNNLGYAIDHSAENESATVQNTSVTEWDNVIRST